MSKKPLTQTFWAAFALSQHRIHALYLLALFPNTLDNPRFTLAQIASRVPRVAVFFAQRIVHGTRLLTVATFQVFNFLDRLLKLKEGKMERK